jgi:hypothetical protein
MGRGRAAANQVMSGFPTGGSLMLGEKILRQLVRDIWFGSLSCHVRHAIKRERTGAMPIRDDARGSVTAMHHRDENVDPWHPSCLSERRRRVVPAGKATLSNYCLTS